MKNINVEVISKGRKYYKCKMNDKYDCKVISTEELEIGKKYDLQVEDISVRSKYGTDLIYSTIQKIDMSAGIATLKHDRYNGILVASAKQIGGKWDSEEKVWVFPKLVENEVEILDNLFNDDIVNIEIKSIGRRFGEQEPVNIFGYKICSAWGRDTGAKLADNICMISGNISSGGSSKNWGTIIDDGSVFRLSVSKNLIDRFPEVSEKWEIKILD